MSELLDDAVKALGDRMSGADFTDSVKFVIDGVGAIMVDADGVRAEDGEADCTLTAEADTFQAIMEGDMNPTAAFMQGKLTVDGDMGVAMRLGSQLA